MPNSAPAAVPVSVAVDDSVSLEAEFRPGVGDLAVVITHPHPLHGGSMHTPVPQCLFDTAAELSLPALRFNFRGVGASTGSHDNGVGERDDVRAALAMLADQASAARLIIAGWSFGADVALAVDADAVVGWFAVAAPLAVVDPADMAAATTAKPKVLAVPQHDQFKDPDAASAQTADWSSTKIEIVPGADHFLAGKLHTVAELFRSFVSTI